MIILYYNSLHKSSAQAYTLLNRYKRDFVPVNVTGKNLANKLKQKGITQVPTVYFLDLHKKIVGLDDIKAWIVPKQIQAPQIESESESSSESEPVAENSFDEIEVEYQESEQEDEDDEISEDSLSF